MYFWLSFICLIISWRRARLISLYLAIMSGFFLGWWRGGIYMNEVRYLSSLSKDSVVLVGTALTDSIYDDKSQVSFTMGNLVQTEPSARKIVGKVGVAGFGENMIYRGDKVIVRGKFYPARGSMVAYLSYSQLDVVARSKSFVFSLTRRFNAGLLNVLPEPLGSFAMGLLIGQRNTLPNEVTAILSAVGLSHIIAVSGYNLTIMMRAGRKLFGGRSKYRVFLGSQALIVVFLLVTGLSASIVRAAIISTLSLGAWYYGRKIKPLVLILFTAALTALWSPLYIWSDLGWWLSFLAFFGVLVLGPLVRRRLFSGQPRGLLGELVMETMAAQIMTLPMVLYIFKTSNFLALPTNVLVVPLIPLAMLLSFVAGLAGMILPAWAGWVAWPARWLLTYLLDIATLFARVPHMQFRTKVNLAAMLFMYFVLVFVCLVLWRKNHKNAKLTDVNNEKLNERSLQMVNN